MDGTREEDCLCAMSGELRRLWLLRCCLLASLLKPALNGGAGLDGKPVIRSIVSRRVGNNRVSSLGISECALDL